jgi:hypothetical protein
MEIEDNFEEYEREYATLSAGFRRQVSLGEYCGIKYRGRPRDFTGVIMIWGAKKEKWRFPPLMEQPNLLQRHGYRNWMLICS